MSTVVAVAPHPDDETLGCGGTLLRHRADGDDIHWLIVTAMDTAHGFAPDRIARRDTVIESVTEDYGFATVTRLDRPTAQLETLVASELIEAIGDAIGSIGAETVYAPFPGDAHSDHRIVFDAVAACTKWFRCPSVRRLYACEILSETDFALRPQQLPFRPNMFVDISDWIDAKVRMLEHYSDEMGEHPFPRSADHVRALALRRGAQAGCMAAEAFMLLRETR